MKRMTLFAAGLAALLAVSFTSISAQQPARSPSMPTMSAASCAAAKGPRPASG